MGTVLLQILPLALGTIAPTMIGLIVIFLSALPHQESDFAFFK
jgi:hypothetical protein